MNKNICVFLLITYALVTEGMVAQPIAKYISPWGITYDNGVYTATKDTYNEYSAIASGPRSSISGKLYIARNNSGLIPQEQAQKIFDELEEVYLEQEKKIRDAIKIRLKKDIHNE